MMERIVRVAGRRDHNAENVHFFAVDTRYYYVNKISFWYWGMYWLRTPRFDKYQLYGLWLCVMHVTP